MSTNGIEGAFNAGYKVKLQNRGAKSSGITFELKSVFDEMAKKGLIKDTDGKGLTKQDALNLYAKLNEMHEQTNRATNYTRMQVGQEFDYTADEMKALAQAAGYELVEPEIETVKQEAILTQEIKESLNEELKPDLTIKTSEIAKPTVETTEKKVEVLEQALVDNKQERRKIRQELRETRQEARADRQLARQLENTDADFSANGQTGKIVNGKYYLNGTEVQQAVYEVAKTKAQSQNEAVENDDIKVEQWRAQVDAEMSEIDENYGFKRFLSDDDKTQELASEYFRFAEDAFGDSMFDEGSKANNAMSETITLLQKKDAGSSAIQNLVKKYNLSRAQAEIFVKDICARGSWMIEYMPLE